MFSKSDHFWNIKQKEHVAKRLVSLYVNIILDGIANKMEWASMVKKDTYLRWFPRCLRAVRSNIPITMEAARRVYASGN